MLSEKLILPADVQLTPVLDLSDDVRHGFAHEETDVAITRVGSRRPTKIVDRDASSFLLEFRKPVGLLDAIICFSRSRAIDPHELLDQCLPLIHSLLEAEFLCIAESGTDQEAIASIAPGHWHEDIEIVSCVQVLEEIEVYHTRSAGGDALALKVLRPGFRSSAAASLAREAAILTHLGGGVAPHLVRQGVWDHRPYLLLEWRAGESASRKATILRDRGAAGAIDALLHLGTSIARAYARLHAQGVIHGDVHPRNVQIGDSGLPTILDFGLSCARDVPSLGAIARGGVAYFLEPEAARARLNEIPDAAVSELGEQFAVAALIYYIVTGKHYCDFRLEQEEMLLQIATASPIPFSARGVDGLELVERVLHRALSKQPDARFNSMSAFADALASAVSSATTVSPRNRWPQFRLDAATALQRKVVATIRSIQSESTPAVLSAPKCSLTYGGAGVAYATLSLANAHDDAELLAVADIWISDALRKARAPGAFENRALGLTAEMIGPGSLFHHLPGLYYVDALISYARGDLIGTQSSINAFAAAANGNGLSLLDLTFGQTGALLGAAALMQKCSLDSNLQLDALEQVGHRTLREIWQTLDRLPIINECLEFDFLGLAHGWAGVLYATLRWCEAANVPLPSSIGDRLLQLAACGNVSAKGAVWPRRIARKPAFDASWCNGTTGMVHLWVAAHRALGLTKWLELAELSGRHVWRDQNCFHSLCCGLTGRAYALFSLYSHTRDRQWLVRARETLQRAINHLPAPDPFFMSLFKGSLGVAVLACEADAMETPAMPVLY